MLPAVLTVLPLVLVVRFTVLLFLVAVAAFVPDDEVPVVLLTVVEVPFEEDVDVPLLVVPVVLLT